MSPSHEFVHLPPAYTEADHRAREEALTEIARLQLEHRAAVSPFVQALLDIDARYAPRVIMVPAA